MKATLLCATRLTVGALALALALAPGGCDTEDATTAVVDNRYPSSEDAGVGPTTLVVYRAWWVATYFNEPVTPGTSSTSLRSVPSDGTAYALLAPGWDPSGEARPTSFAVRQSRAPLSSARGQELHIVVSDETFLGGCGAPLTEADRDFIAERIFPAELTGFAYDPLSCAFQPVAPGRDAGN